MGGLHARDAMPGRAMPATSQARPGLGETPQSESSILSLLYQASMYLCPSLNVFMYQMSSSTHDDGPRKVVHCLNTTSRFLGSYMLPFPSRPSPLLPSPLDFHYLQYLLFLPYHIYTHSFALYLGSFATALCLLVYCIVSSSLKLLQLI